MKATSSTMSAVGAAPGASVIERGAFGISVGRLVGVPRPAGASVFAKRVAGVTNGSATSRE
jgi:hypothetical protein